MFHTVDIPAAGGADLPFILPGATPITGVNDFAGNPFWFDGHAPSLGLNPQVLAPIGGKTYNGSSRVASGGPFSPRASNTFKVTFSKAGTYKYYCDIHPGMIGYVVVRPKGKPIPSAKQDAAALTRQLTTIVLSAPKLLKTKVPANTVSLGLSTAQGFELYSMFPGTLTVNHGTVVTFSMSANSREEHTASFGPAAYLMKLNNGLLSAPGPTAQTLYPSDSPALGPIPVSPTSHGNGFANTGGLDQDPHTPQGPSLRVDFTTPGTYHYICLIHPDMQGTIIVR